MEKANRLINQKSPYLLQHAYNPVDWYPWSEEAFIAAAREDKPVFLSIGYSTCHWCHVMEKESFEDEQVAELLNDAFICIKVDREERPDIDGIYMSVCQMLTGGGGWPLTVVMTPDKKPFFTGTYFPKYNRFNRIGLLELVPKLKEVWSGRREEILQSAEEIIISLNNAGVESGSEVLTKGIFNKAFDEFSRRYDREKGGFGTAPKFPSPHNLLFLMRYWKKYSNKDALHMVENTLTRMRLGGIYDHIGFGFARYSTDKNWLVPHFEKMLYDQAMLVMAYTEAYLATKNSFYKQTAEEILEYVLRDMTHAEGGFFSAEDADSEGEEGRFYLWDADELRNVLDKNEYIFAVKIFNVQEAGNWMDESRGMMPGTNILYLSKPLNHLADDLNLSESDFLLKLDEVRKKLFEYRKKRIHPHKDDKVLTDWNSLMISALARAGQAFNNEIYTAAAASAFSFIEKYLIGAEGRLIHRYREGESGLPAHIDDYSFLIGAAIDMYETTFDYKYLKKALELNDILIDEFWDRNKGGFFFTSDKSEVLITRQKELYDGAIPSGNSVALLNLLRLLKLTGKTSLNDYIEGHVKSFSGPVVKSPSFFSQFLCGLDFYFGPSAEIVISTAGINSSASEALRLIRESFYPNKVVVLNLPDQNKELKKLVGYLKDMNPIEGKPTYYVCRDFICSRPVNSVKDLEFLFKNK